MIFPHRKVGDILLLDHTNFNRTYRATGRKSRDEVRSNNNFPGVCVIAIHICLNRTIESYSDIERLKN